MSEFDKDLKVGDVIRAYHKGYHVVTDIERRFHTQDDVSRYPSKNLKVGQEYNSLIHYRTVLTASFKPVKYSKSKAIQTCDSQFCKKLTSKLLMDERDKKIQDLKDGYDRVICLIGAE